MKANERKKDTATAQFSCKPWIRSLLATSLFVLKHFFQLTMLLCSLILGHMMHTWLENASGGCGLEIPTFLFDDDAPLHKSMKNTMQDVKTPCMVKRDAAIKNQIHAASSPALQKQGVEKRWNQAFKKSFQRLFLLYTDKGILTS